ncbi:MAG: M67 family metallopeptidase [Acidimicrobiia bacterium]|nr:M67 family metallopeptidase [Acidimicrobiia bacterium]
MTIRLPGEVREAILTHAANCEPEECCGLLASNASGEVRFVYPLTNSDHSERSFTIEESESYSAFLHADRSGWSISGVFHSHPRGPDVLSDRDLDGAVDSGWLHVLVSPGGLRAFRVEGGAAVEVELI